MKGYPKCFIIIYKMSSSIFGFFVHECRCIVAVMKFILNYEWGWVKFMELMCGNESNYGTGVWKGIKFMGFLWDGIKFRMFRMFNDHYRHQTPTEAPNTNQRHQTPTEAPNTNWGTNWVWGTKHQLRHQTLTRGTKHPNTNQPKTPTRCTKHHQPRHQPRHQPPTQTPTKTPTDQLPPRNHLNSL